jgi:hypothetical protein
MLVVEVDLTGLRASKKAELSTKRYFSGSRNTTGRRLVRVSAPSYGEIIFSKLHPGNTNSCQVLKQTINEVERGPWMLPHKRHTTLIRLDGGFGTDENIEWLCSCGHQFVVKGYGGGLGNWRGVWPRTLGTKGPPPGSCWRSPPKKPPVTLGRPRPSLVHLQTRW